MANKGSARESANMAYHLVPQASFDNNYLCKSTQGIPHRSMLLPGAPKEELGRLRKDQEHKTNLAQLSSAACSRRKPSKHGELYDYHSGAGGQPIHRNPGPGLHDAS